MPKLQIENEKSDFTDWMYDRDLSEKEKRLWNFHKWIREETDLNSGTRVDYRKYVAEYLNEEGDIVTQPEDVESSHKSAAVSKFLDYKEVVLERLKRRKEEAESKADYVSLRDNAKQNSKGDS